MFTGIVQDLGVVDKIEKRHSEMKLKIKTSFKSEDVKVGDSICINGACLTVSRTSLSGFQADVSRETLAKTNLGELHVGSKVHLELALRAGDRFGGHIVQGHVDGTGTIRRIRKIGHDLIVRVSYPSYLDDLFVGKGSVALDGVSLTISELGRGWLEVTLIPFTLQNTLLASLKVGGKINIEADLIGKYLKKWHGKG